MAAETKRRSQAKLMYRGNNSQYFLHIFVDKRSQIHYNLNIQVKLSPCILYIETEDIHMKKIIAVLLSVLLLFSALSVVSFAEGEVEEKPIYKITFVDYDGTPLGSRQVPQGGIISAPENPARAEDKENKIEYIFKGWSSDGGAPTYSGNTLPLATADVTYTAVYAENKKGDNLTFWQLVASIFARINKIFEYFNKLFDFDFNRP